MAFDLTDMQKLAVNTKGNILVSAAAGSGKTAVLVERVINMLTDKSSPTSADRLLIVTFTNAAAAEMRSRIEKRLFEEIQKNPDDISLQKQKYLLNSADICTIDSFCIKLVRENFEKCGIEPDFKISDGTGQTATYNAVMSGLISECLENPSQDFEHLLELTNCERDEKNLTELISRVYLYSQQLPFAEQFISNLSKPYETPFKSGNAWYDMAFEIAEKRVDTLKNCAQKMAEVAPYTEKNQTGHIEYAEYVFDIVDKIDSLISSKNWDGITELLNETALKRVPSASKDDISANIFKQNQKQMKEVIEKLKGLFYAPSAEIQNSLDKSCGAVKLLCDLISEYGKRLFTAFSEENAFTFYNMEQLALGLLCEYKDGEILIREEAKQLCERYDEVLVDEFQDVNDLQNMLFYVLSNREERLFVVGDVKQSIYGFRGSNPDNFLKKKNAYTPVEHAGKNDSKKIILSDNFRSRPGVCDVVNFFFGILLGGQCSDIIYDEEERLNAGGTFPENEAPTAELLVVDKFDNAGEESLLEAEAQKIAEYIISIMDEGDVITEGNTLRRARFSDFAILLDAVKNKAPVIAEVLSGYGIPVSLGGDSFLESIEISTVMSLLQVIDNPKCDVELLSIMMSPIFGFTAEEMAKIRAGSKYGCLYSAVVAYSKSGDKKATDFIQTLADFRRDATVMSIERLISKLLHVTDILNYMSALPGGKIRRANLYLLIQYASGYVSRSDGGIYGFIRYINSLPENSFKIASLGGENSVKIMSMHNSKGLQFPVCIVANLASQINNADSISRVLFSEKNGIAFNYYDEHQGHEVRMLGHIVQANAARVKTVEEKLRLLYVAMTRAIDRLCLVCSAKNLDKKLNSLSASLLDEPPYISREFLEKCRNMGDWILSCTLLHPNGEKLCRYADVKQKPISSNSDLNITVFNSFNEQEKYVQCEEKDASECNSDFVQKIKANAGYVYPYEPLRYLQAKASVSDLVHKADNDRFAFTQKPAFMMGEKLSGAAKGTAMHHIMQYINFSDSVNVTAEIERLLEWKFITESEAASADITAIENFFNSELYHRIMSSDDIRREMRFLSEIAANRIDPDIDINIDNANIIVQGAVDLCFVEPDGIVVLDFKTDRVDNMNDLVKSYGEQLKIYSVAAEKIFEKPVKEKIIYSFHLGESISF